MNKLSFLNIPSSLIILFAFFSCSKSQDCEFEKTADLNIDSPNAMVDVNSDGVDDITFSFDSYSSSVASGGFFEVKGTEDWSIAVTTKFDTIIIDTTGMIDTINQFSTLRYDVRSYRPNIDSFWDQIRTITFPEIIVELDSIDCQSLEFQNEVSIFTSHMSHSPFGFHDRNTKGISNFDGYMIVKDEIDCYYIRVRYIDSKLSLTTIYRECT